ncbi:MAG TPA: diguanylate cyclase [Azospirillaceae bacterium]|nr:diguanylate cyclase [Azospirillaceae bacterium]HRQ80704.1 diguanylate cyclase [Azospirillaceae bacterium]
MFIAPSRADSGFSATFCVDPDWPPYEIINQNGEHEGIAADLLRLAAERAGVGLKLIRAKDWDESVAASKRGDCDMLSFLNQTPKRDEWLIFTDPIFTDPNVVITREEHAYVSDLAELSGRVIALPKGTSIEERVRRDYPNLRVVVADSESEAFAMVSDRRADLTIRSMTVAVYTIKKEGWFNLKIAGQVPGYENRLRVGVRKENPALRDALNRGVVMVTPQERREIANRHVSINVQTAVDYGPLRNVAILFSVFLVTSLAWGLKLKKVNAQLRWASETDNLTRLLNRATLDRRFAEEIERAKRYGRAFSVILLDIDHFKLVNDEMGHLAGDRVLAACAALLRSSTRTTDVVGRWGGEEFLIFCPETAGPEALRVAERICAAARAHDFHTGRSHTFSAGAAELRPDDDMDDLLQRADAALYQAKSAGRDQARLSV